MICTLTALERNHVTVVGSGPQTLLFAHGFGCDQNMWRLVAPAFADRYRVVLFDLVGAGQSDLAAYDRAKYSSLHGYAADVLEIIDALELEQVVFVGHSVSAMIGVLAAIEQPARFRKLVLVAPSPCYLNEGAYTGGLEPADVEELLALLDHNYLGWAGHMAATIAGAAQPQLSQEMADSFCRSRPDIIRHFARVTFFSDNRPDLPQVRTPALILQCADDVLAPVAVGDYLHRHLAGSQLALIDTHGHCPHLSAPEATVAAINRFL